MTLYLLSLINVTWTIFFIHWFLAVSFNYQWYKMKIISALFAFLPHSPPIFWWLCHYFIYWQKIFIVCSVKQIVLYRLILKTEYNSWCLRCYNYICVCTYIYLYFHFVIKCLNCRGWNVAIWIMTSVPLTRECSKHYFKQPLFSSSHACYIYLLYIYFALCLDLYYIVYHFIWLVFLELLSSFFFF